MRRGADQVDKVVHLVCSVPLARAEQSKCASCTLELAPGSPRAREKLQFLQFFPSPCFSREFRRSASAFDLSRSWSPRRSVNKPMNGRNLPDLTGSPRLVSIFSVTDGRMVIYAEARKLIIVFIYLRLTLAAPRLGRRMSTLGRCVRATLARWSWWHPFDFWRISAAQSGIRARLSRPRRFQNLVSGPHPICKSEPPFLWISRRVPASCWRSNPLLPNDCVARFPKPSGRNRASTWGNLCTRRLSQRDGLSASLGEPQFTAIFPVSSRDISPHPGPSRISRNECQGTPMAAWRGICPNRAGAPPA